MSSTEEKELKAGHPPAVKAGGMRVARSHRNSEGEKEKPTEEDKEFAEEQPSKGEKHKETVLVSGAAVKEDKAFPAQAVKHFHNKPIPSKENRQPSRVHNIQQPSKQ